jgi:hypothetical protein
VRCSKPERMKLASRAGPGRSVYPRKMAQASPMEEAPRLETDLQNAFTEWSIDGVPTNDRTDAWQDVLSHSYREWQVPQRLPATFYASVKQHDFAGAGIVETICDPCIGQRTRAQVRHDDDLYVGVQLTTGGRERFRIGDSGVEVTSGDLVVWTTDQEVQFEVLERLHKVTLMIPWSLMRERLPERKQPPSGGKIESRTGVGSLLAVHLLALSNQIDSLDQPVHARTSWHCPVGPAALGDVRCECGDAAAREGFHPAASS